MLMYAARSLSHQIVSKNVFHSDSVLLCNLFNFIKSETYCSLTMYIYVALIDVKLAYMITLTSSAITDPYLVDSVMDFCLTTLFVCTKTLLVVVITLKGGILFSSSKIGRCMNDCTPDDDYYIF